MPELRVGRASGNLFLDKLPAAALARIAALLKKIDLPNGRIILEPHQDMNEVLFPIASVVSVVVEMRDGDTAEVGFIGYEGMTGAMLALGEGRTNQRSIVQIADGAFSIPADEFVAALRDTPELKAHTLRYAQATLAMAGQIVACNVLHPVNERCARWLLMAHDRVDGDVLDLTQEFLGQMLGVRRASVAAAASALQDAGLISYSRGRITVRDRLGLEAASCECYQSIEREWQRIMGYSAGKP